MIFTENINMDFESIDNFLFAPFYKKDKLIAKQFKVQKDSDEFWIISAMLDLNQKNFIPNKAKKYRSKTL
ncbi:hypothetical protein GGQ84_001889 [Desulfitispora alkaliphila]